MSVHKKAQTNFMASLASSEWLTKIDWTLTPWGSFYSAPSKHNCIHCPLPVPLHSPLFDPTRQKRLCWSRPVAVWPRLQLKEFELIDWLILEDNMKIWIRAFVVSFHFYTHTIRFTHIPKGFRIVRNPNKWYTFIHLSDLNGIEYG